MRYASTPRLGWRDHLSYTNSPQTPCEPAAHVLKCQQGQCTCQQWGLRVKSKHTLFYAYTQRQIMPLRLRVVHLFILGAEVCQQVSDVLRTLNCLNHACCWCGNNSGAGGEAALTLRREMFDLWCCSSLNAPRQTKLTGVHCCFNKNGLWLVCRAVLLLLHSMKK